MTHVHICGYCEARLRPFERCGCSGAMAARPVPDLIGCLSCGKLGPRGEKCHSCAARASQPQNIKPYIADEAKKIVDGARRGAYGTPEDNFERIARFWTAYFQNTGRDLVISAKDVSPMMRLMKEARLCETPDHLDSHIDLVGYTLTGAEVNGVKP